MESTKKSLAEWILSRPEGKQFLSAVILTVMALSTCVVIMEIRYEKNIAKIQNCEQEKQVITQQYSDRFLDFVIKANEQAERTKQKYDSLSEELFKIKLK